MNREQIYAALFSRVSSIPDIVTASRRLKHWNDVPDHEQPALFQSQKDELANARSDLPTVWTFNVELYLYCHSGGNPDAVPATILNPLLDAIEDAFKPDYSGYQTLGGLVHDCVIDGRIETDEGLLGPQSIAIIPIKITVVSD